MSIVSEGWYSQYSDFLTFGRSELPIFATIAGETILLAATVFVANPPFLPVPVNTSIALLITSLLTLLLAGILYGLLSGIGYRTYSVKFHDPVHILKCLISYICLSVLIIYLGYLLLVYPYNGTIIPQPVDWGIGAVCSVAYAISIAAIFYGHDYLSEDRKAKPEAIATFLSAVQNLRKKPESEIENEPENLINAGKTIRTGLKASNMGDSIQLAKDLQEWLDTFEQRELRGQKKMVGDFPDTDTRFQVWEARYQAFRELNSELEKMDNSALHRILLSIRSKWL